DIGAQGAIRRYSFYPAVMHSRARLTYTQVWTALSAPPEDAAKGLPDADLLLEFDVHGKIVRIVPAPRNDAHKLIEECMLAANVSTADFLATAQHAAL